MQLEPSRLDQILEDLGKPFCEISKEGREALRDSINKRWKLYLDWRSYRGEVAPSERIRHWKRIKAQAEKLLELLDARGIEADLGYELDRLMNRDHEHEFIEYRKIHFPSRFAKIEVLNIKHSLIALKLSSATAQEAEAKLKDRSRKSDQLRLIFIARVSCVFEETFRIQASAHRDGRWCEFLSQIMTALDDKDVTVEAAYDDWLAVRAALIDKGKA